MIINKLPKMSLEARAEMPVSDILTQNVSGTCPQLFMPDGVADPHGSAGDGPERRNDSEEEVLQENIQTYNNSVCSRTSTMHAGGEGSV